MDRYNNGITLTQTPPLHYQNWFTLPDGEYDY